MSKSFKTNDLYVGLLASVEINEKEELTFTPTHQAIVFQLNPYGRCWHPTKAGDAIDARIATDVLTDKQYYFCIGDPPLYTILKSVGGCGIYEFFPIEKYMDFLDHKISKKAVQTLVYDLNHKEKDIDIIALTILETRSGIHESDLPEEVKQPFEKKLSDLCNQYVNDMELYRNQKESSPFKSEYEIRMHYMRNLVEIEKRIYHSTSIPELPEDAPQYQIKMGLLK